VAEVGWSRGRAAEDADGRGPRRAARARARLKAVGPAQARLAGQAGLAERRAVVVARDDRPVEVGRAAQALPPRDLVAQEIQLSACARQGPRLGS